MKKESISNANCKFFFVFFLKFKYSLWHFIFSQLWLLAHDLNLLIWQKKMYEQYPSKMYFKLNPGALITSQYFHFFGTTLTFLTVLLQIWNTILTSVILVWIYGRSLWCWYNFLNSRWFIMLFYNDKAQPTD